MTDFVPPPLKSPIVLPKDYQSATFSICSMAGIEQWRREIVTLQKLKRAIALSIFEAERAASWEQFLSRGLLGAVFIKSSCEAFLEMAGSLGKLAGLKGTSDMSKYLSAGIKVADSGSRLATGADTDVVGTAIAVGTAVGAKAMTDNEAGDALKAMMESSGIQMEMLNDALKHRDLKLMQAMFIKYPAKMTQMLLYMADKKLAGNWVGAITTLANAGYSYSKKLDDAFKARVNDLEQERQKRLLIRDMKLHVAKVSLQIEGIGELVNRCVRWQMTTRT